MTTLQTNATLADYQKYLKQVVIERGFDRESVSEVFTVFVEEVGELAKAIRKANAQKTGAHSHTHDVEEELADVFFMLVDLTNRLGIDLGKAFADKETKNNQRTWS